MLLAEPIAWRTIRPAFAYELEPGFAPEQDNVPATKPWLDPEQMKLAQKVLDNHMQRSKRGIRDRSGERYGKLLVLKLHRMSARTSTWLCICECGKTKIVASGNLLSHNTQSCGCLRRESGRRNLAKALAAKLAKGRAA